MKHLLKLTIVLVSAIILACNQPGRRNTPTGSTSPIAEKKGKGEIKFFEEMHNFGHVKAGEILSYSFKFKNIGEGAIRLNHAEVSCDCLEVRLPEGATAKDSMDYLEVIFHTAGEWGNTIKSIKVTADNQTSKELMIGAYIENESFENKLNN